MNDGELREKALHLSSFIVEAPAGSGKTSLLTDRFLKLLTVVDMPEEIVAITFTKKAASEMKAKIIERIKESKSPFAQTILKRSEEKGWDIEHNLSRLKVMTIDKFCHNVVSQIPVLSKMGSKPNITDTPEKFYEESVKQTLQAKDGIEDIKVVFTHYDNEYEKINRRLVAMMSIRDQWKYRCYMLTQKSSGQIIEEGNAYLEHLTKPIYQKISTELNQDQLNDLIEILHYLESTNLREDIKLKNKNSFNFDSEEIPLWQTITKILFTDKNTRRENITAREGFKNDDEGEIYKNKCRNLPNIDFLLAIKAIPEPLSETYALKLRSAGIIVVWDKAIDIFQKLTWPKFTKLAEKTFPGLASLHPDAYGAIISLVFNRGTSLKGDSRKEMVNIKNLILKKLKLI